ncbi:hypothetical protein HPB51_012193 [Rhipicephalus microplus]|uniref:Uncharacterized protein n=1 Tax=Rhipicephalus microplus TaxID=6941 RepID=A0A9J6D9P2_RHIMP|nr:hypothetical protein HPB51_012193 [Rhipicephalus microplus]
MPLGGSAMPLGALYWHIQNEAGSKFLAAVPVLKDLHADMVLGAYYLLYGEVQLTIDGGRVKLSCLTLISAPDSPVGRPHSQVSSKESRLSDQPVGDLPTTRQSLAGCASTSLNESMAAEGTIIDAIPVLLGSADHALVEASDAPQAGVVSISSSGPPAYGSTGDDRQLNMISRKSECRADHQEAVCANEESGVDRPDSDQLARSSEMTPSPAPGVCSVMCRHGGVNPRGSRGTQKPWSLLLPRGRRTGKGSDNSAEVPS